MFKISTVADKGAPTIETESGPIYADTPEAARYLEAKAIADPLRSLVLGVQAMALTKPQALDLVVQMLASLPAAHERLSEDLRGLRTVLETGGDFAPIMVRLEHDHLSRIQFGMGCTSSSAPAPLRPGTITKDDPRHPEHPLNPTQQHKSLPRNA
ncbi:hypothetical protein [Pseudorhodoferax soli]|uniref:Uncharacterized protein n=1 Tax=Pseudorhodoferax soli TaxID=545864 RepID=A0A368XQ57_9BURK|nr:hypothetical protein [Pseudorhodoferax soli]RCW70103.1 hypothetical protein DES41_10539 [Pseudorhodoferax soli]